MAAIAPDFTLIYNDRDITEDIRPYVISIDFTDRFDGESDELEVSLSDPDGRWQDKWYPEKDAAMELHYGYRGAELASAGQFDVDEIELTGPPNQVTIRALAVGLTRQNRTRLGKAYEKTTLSAIVNQVAKRMKAKVFGTIAAIPIKKATQYQENDWAFLVRICREHGYRVKITDNSRKLVVEKLESLAQSTVRVLKPSDISGWTYHDKITEVPAKSSVRYHSPEKKALVKGDATAGKVASGKTAQHVNKRHAQAGSPAQATAMAEAEQSRHEVDKTSLEINLEGDQRLVAGAAVTLQDFGKMDGDYVLSEARHSISRSGYKMSFQSKRVKS